ncbi:hypothetical protein HTIA_2127 [Halorhabdus tiamatea SARL4B]|uniref:Uncharacterized protein n=1 Tax=Halorhabdus tiamatea SARL4B TaxID=1033806 RepID=S6D8X9_9EURY|nr:hypothetical protein HTIA_0174 [Halorhabdus tiamatea SARL4B]CCQ34241.1 hypothetical protein HTIA_2127 [Halorhabdus tiamatea SARL4B]
MSRLAVCLTRTFRVPFFESARARTRLLGTFLTSHDVDLVSFANTSEIKLWIVVKSVLDFMDEVQDRLVCSVKFLSYL